MNTILWLNYTSIKKKTRVILRERGSKSIDSILLVQYLCLTPRMARATWENGSIAWTTVKERGNQNHFQIQLSPLLFCLGQITSPLWGSIASRENSGEDSSPVYLSGPGDVGTQNMEDSDLFSSEMSEITQRLLPGGCQWVNASNKKKPSSQMLKVTLKKCGVGGSWHLQLISSQLINTSD